jgi:hypothetical protein
MSRKGIALTTQAQGNPQGQTSTDSNHLSCAGCGKVGVSICAKCAKKPACLGKLKKKTAKQATAQREIISDDAGFYGRLEGMSQLPFEGNKKSWGGLCLEIGANKYYIHLELLAEIVREGKWREGVRNLKAWLCKSLARRVERLEGKEDYGPNGMRRPGKPKFDKRNGALTALSERPFTEFEKDVGGDGNTMSPIDVIEDRIARKNLQTADGWDDLPSFPIPANRESLWLLGRRTLAEQCEASRCAQMVGALKHDRPTFDKALAKAVIGQQWLVGRMRLDQDEAEVVAVTLLLWNTGPRMYLNFLDEANKRRMRNAWDRLGRRMEKPDFRRALRRLLAMRRGPEYPNPSVTAQHVVRVKHDGDFRDSTQRKEKVLHNSFVQRFCASLAAPGVRAIMPSDRSQKTPGVVDLLFDLAPKERLSYVASAGKGPASAIQEKLYSE